MRSLVLASAGATLASCLVWVACSSNSKPGGTSSGGTSGSSSGGADSGGGLFALAVPCTDAVSSIYGDPGTLPTGYGDIIHCATEADISAADLQAALTNNPVNDPPEPALGYTGKPFTSGAHVFRVLYRTERGDPNNSPGYSSAKVLMPITPRASGTLPLLVGAHGTAGQAAACAPSTGQTSPWVTGDYDAQIYPMVGLGFPIIIPDLAGYANYGATGNPPSAYAQYEDEGKSTLDGARALAKMFPNAFDGKVVLVGHSQGGHTALSALAISSTYAPELSIAAVATYAPLWLSQRSWGALLFEAADYPLSTEPTANAVSFWYHYTHGELLDGPGQGLAPFSTSQQAVIKNFVATDCDAQGWDGSTPSEYPDLQAAGQTAASFFSSSFVSSIAKPAALGTACATGDTVCATWIQRYTEDRPHLTTSVPLLIEYGAMDQTIPPDDMACATDRLVSDNVAFQFCVSPDTGHEAILREQASYVADWIAAQTLGEPAPAPCATSNTISDDAGVIACSTPPPND
jgi:alpha-beta hydrolase superfamily lysophospholipase